MKSALLVPLIMLCLALQALPRAGAQTTPASAKPAPIEVQPYRIHALLSVDPATRLDDKTLARLATDWRLLVARFIGSPWILTLDRAEGSLAHLSPESLLPAQFAPFSGKYDQVWYIAITPSRAGALEFTGRSIDLATSQFGPVQAPSQSPAGDTARALLDLSLKLFTPRAVIGPAEAGKVRVLVQAAGMGASSPLGQVVKPGAVLVPYRLLQNPDGSLLRVAPINWTYLLVDEVRGSTALCSILSSLRDPLSRRVIGKSELVALGLNTSATPLRFRFITRPPDSRPAAGYVLTTRRPPDGATQIVGITDRDGRIEVPTPAAAQGPLLARLVAGDDEPLVEFPIMPGETAVERVLRVDPLTDAVTLESRLNALQDEIIDQVAIRSRLQALLESRVQGNAWDDVKALLLEYAKLPPRQGFTDRLNQLKENAQKTQTDKKTPVLTRTAQARLSEVETLITTYLDDEIFQAYQRAAADAATGAVVLPGADWSPFEYPGSGLSALMPGKPTRARSLLPIGAGRTPLSVFQSSWEDRLFQLGVGTSGAQAGPLDPAASRAPLLSIRDAIIAGVAGASVVSQNEVARGPLNGLDTTIAFDSPDPAAGKQRARILLLLLPQARVAALSATGAADKLDSPEVNTFFNSARYTGPIETAAEPRAAPAPSKPAGSTSF